MGEEKAEPDMGADLDSSLSLNKALRAVRLSERRFACPWRPWR